MEITARCGFAAEEGAIVFSAALGSTLKTIRTDAAVFILAGRVMQVYSPLTFELRLMGRPTIRARYSKKYCYLLLEVNRIVEHEN